MADEKTHGADTGAPPAGASNTETENRVPQARFNEVNNALKDVVAELTALKTANQTAETERLEQQQQWQTLAESRKAEIDRLKAVEDNFTSVNTTLEGLLESQLSELSDDAKLMVPKALSLQDQLNWIAENRTRLTRPSAPPMDAGARGDRVKPTAALTHEELPAFKASGLSLEDWNKNKNAPQPARDDSFIADLRARNKPQE